MERDKDFHKLMNRIAIATAIFIVVAIGVQFCKNNPPKKVLFGETTIRVYDTLDVRTQEALDHRIIVGYVIKISPQDMTELHKVEFEKNEREYFRRHIMLRVEDKTRFVISREIRFDELDSIPIVAKRFRDLSLQTIRDEAFKKVDLNNGLSVYSVECYLELNSVLSRFMK